MQGKVEGLNVEFSVLRGYTRGVPASADDQPEDPPEPGDGSARAARRPRELRNFSPENPLLTSEEVAELLGVSPKTVVIMAKRGSLPARHIPGTRRYLFFEREIFELLDASKVVPGSDPTEAAAEPQPVKTPAASAPPKKQSPSASTVRGRKKA